MYNLHILQPHCIVTLQQQEETRKNLINSTMQFPLPSLHWNWLLQMQQQKNGTSHLMWFPLDTRRISRINEACENVVCNRTAAFCQLGLAWTNTIFINTYKRSAHATVGPLAASCVSNRWPIDETHCTHMSHLKIIARTTEPLAGWESHESRRS